MIWKLLREDVLKHSAHTDLILGWGTDIRMGSFHIWSRTKCHHYLIASSYITYLLYPSSISVCLREGSSMVYTSGGAQVYRTHRWSRSFQAFAPGEREASVPFLRLLAHSGQGSRKKDPKRGLMLPIQFTVRKKVKLSSGRPD